MAFLEVGDQARAGRLLLDLLASGDQAGIQDAAETFLASLGHNACSGIVHPTAPAAHSEDDVT